jgi:hypothetical protein
VKEELEDLKDSQNPMRENEDEDDEDVYGGAKVKRKQGEEDEDAEIVDAGDEDLDEIKVGVKRQRENDDIQDKRKLKRQKKLLFRRYYSGTFYWRSSSQLVY